MKKAILLVFSTLFIITCSPDYSENNSFYPANPDPLLQKKLVKLPLGAISPQGWLKNQLEAQAHGLTGHLDEFWPDLINSQWKGGDGDWWERTPYFLDGLLPLAFILNDATLINKAKPYIEWILDSQKENGWFGPGNPWERWPLAIACKVLTSYYEVTQDDRAMNILKGYFRYLHDNSPDWPDDSWRGMRAMEHAVTGYWLYSRTGDKQILETIESIFNNSFNWTTYYETFPWDENAAQEGRIPHNWNADGLTAHVVNNAMAFKYPGLWYQQSKNERHKNAVYWALEKYQSNHGQVGGRFSGDEHLSGRRPTQGTEMCAVVESMFSLENLIEIFADIAFADQLEFLAYNSLPGTMTPDCWAHQYDQQANQVLVTVAKRDWSTNGDYSNIYGLMPNFPCCLANMHQGWPKLVEHMWYATHDNGIAALVYGPNKVTAKVAQGNQVTIAQQTNYPFDSTITFTMSLKKSSKFPLYLRIPEWAEDAQTTINGSNPQKWSSGQMVKIHRKWKNSDILQLEFPFLLCTEQRYNNAVAIRRGPLYYSLRIGKDYKKISFREESFYSIDYMGSVDWQIQPTTAWNYGLAIDPSDPAKDIQINTFSIHEFPFGDRGDMVYWQPFDNIVSWQHDAPVVLLCPAKKIPSWGEKNNSADDPPQSPVPVETEMETIELVPYGCARLRISEFPIVTY